MNFADQRRAAAKRSSVLQHEDKMPQDWMFDNDSDDKVEVQYQGENDSMNLDIMDSGPKGTVVNKPNAAFKKHHPMSQQDTEYVEQKRFRE